MSNGSLSVQAKIVEVDVYDAEDAHDGHTGHIDVRYWLERGEEVLGVANVRIYFKRTDISLDDLSASAKAHARRVLSQIVENFTVDLDDLGPEKLWAE
jgi:hypothetical protein